MELRKVFILRLIVFLSCLHLFTSLTYAETLRLKSGKVIEGRIIWNDGTHVTIVSGEKRSTYF